MPAWYHMFIEAQCAIALADITIMADGFFIICTSIIISYCFDFSIQENEFNSKPYVIYALAQHECLLYFVACKQEYLLIIFRN